MWRRVAGFNRAYRQPMQYADLPGTGLLLTQLLQVLLNVEQLLFKMAVEEIGTFDGQAQFIDRDLTLFDGPGNRFQFRFTGSVAIRWRGESGDGQLIDGHGASFLVTVAGKIGRAHV